MLNYFEQLGVKLDPFYQALWNHLFVVELIKAKYKIAGAPHGASILGRLAALFSSDTRIKCLKYLESWGEEHFWQETETRALEITSRFEDRLQSEIGASASILSARTTADTAETSEIKKEIALRAQRMVDAIQLRELHQIVDVFSEELFSDEQNSYYLLIDDLDQQWAENRIRYKLIRALLDTIRRFRRIPAVRVVICLRRDLLEMVIEETRDSGFQEEKYEDLYLTLHWSDKDLRNIIDSRITFAIKRKYARQERVGFFDIMPDKVFGMNTLSYMLERTHKRPREIIQFVNKVLAQAAGSSQIAQTTISEAESKYSEQRRNAVYDEWRENYPMLRQCARLLAGKPARFRISDITFPELQDCVLAVAMSFSDNSELTKEAKFIVEKGAAFKSSDLFNFARHLAVMLYTTGLVGIKIGSQSAPHWSPLSEFRISPESIHMDDLIYVHPMFYRVFGVNPAVG